MGQLVRQADGSLVLVTDDQASGMAARGELAPDQELRYRTGDGDVVTARPDQVGKLAAGAHGESATQTHALGHQRDMERRYAEGAGNFAATIGEGIGRGLTLGGSDALLRALGVEGMDARRSYHPFASTLSEIGGALAPTILSGGSTAGASAAEIGVGAGRAALRLAPSAIAMEIGGAATARYGAIAGGLVEGAVFGAGQGVSEIALSDEPITAERIVSTLSSNALLGAATGGAVSLAGQAVEKGLMRGRAALTKEAQAAELAMAVPESVASLDPMARKAARQTELARIETERVTSRAQLADEIQELRVAAKEAKPWLVTKEAPEFAGTGVGKAALKADRRIDGLVDDLKTLAERPQVAEGALRRTEQAWQSIIEQEPAIRARLIKEGAEGGERWKALDSISGLLEKNRAVQGRLAEITAAPASPMLKALDAADAAAAAVKPGGSLIQKAGEGAIFSGVTGLAAAAGVPYPIAALGASMVSEKIGGMIFGRAAKASAETTQRIVKAIDGLIEGGRKASQAAQPVASKILSRVRFAGDTPAAVNTAPAKNRLVTAYRQRERELRAQTVPGPDGKSQMTMGARMGLGQRLAAVRAKSPVLADMLETVMARRVAFLADKLPKRPDTAAMQLGPDRWRPSDFEIASFARSVAAAEDPASVVERVANGTITPEDAEAFRAVYPEMYRLTRDAILAKLPAIRKTMPYDKRLAMSIFFDAPVDPAMSSGVLTVLQGGFTEEPGTEGGVQAPKPQPQFGSIRSQDKTPSQERAS